MKLFYCVQFCFIVLTHFHFHHSLAGTEVFLLAVCIIDEQPNKIHINVWMFRWPQKWISVVLRLLITSKKNSTVLKSPEKGNSFKNSTFWTCQVWLFHWFQVLKIIILLTQKSLAICHNSFKSRLIKIHYLYLYKTYL